MPLRTAGTKLLFNLFYYIYFPVLENCLRNFSCLTTGDVIAIKYNSKAYELCVLETKPGNAVIIIECDMNVSMTLSIKYANNLKGC